MQIVKIEPKDIQITLAFSVQELLLLVKGLEATELKLNMESDQDQEVAVFMTDTLYQTVAGVVKELVPGD